MTPAHHLSELSQIYQETDRDEKSPHALHDEENKVGRVG